MTIPVIVERELLVRARQARTHWTRMCIGALAVLSGLQFFLVWGDMYGDLTQTAISAFRTLSWLGFLVACTGCLLTADCVSSEGREGTLGLLVLTRVSAREVILGKLAAHGLTALFGLVALMPILMLPVLAGGVTWREVLWTAASWLALLWVSLCLGLWVSSKIGGMAQSLRRAVIWFLVVTLPPLLLGALQVQAGAVELGRLVRALSPAGAFLETWNPAATFSGLALFASLGASCAWGCLFLALAGYELRRSEMVETGERVRPAPGGGVPANHTNGLACSGGELPSAEKPVGVMPTGTAGTVTGSRPRRPLGDINPVEWLLVQDKAQVWMLWLAAGISLVLPFSNVILRYLGGISAMGLFSAFLLLGGIASAALFALAGARFLSGARRDGSLELLCTTPLGAGTMIQSAWHVLRRRLIGPLILLFVLALIQQLSVWFLIYRAPGSFPYGPFSLLMRQLVATACPLFDAVALCWLGMWFGLRARSLLSAVLLSVGLVWGLDWVLTYGGYVLSNFFASGVTSAPLGGWRFFSFTVVPFLTIGKQVWLVLWARKQLRGNSVGMEPVEFSTIWRSGIAWLRRARHWTGGGA